MNGDNRQSTVILTCQKCGLKLQAVQAAMLKLTVCKRCGGTMKQEGKP